MLINWAALRGCPVFYLYLRGDTIAVTGTTLIADFRELTGRGSTNDISDVAVLAAINEYYTDNFPLEVDIGDILEDYTAQAEVYDDGEFDLADTTLDLNLPIFANQFEMTLIEDPQVFYLRYPEDQLECFRTKPGLVIGSSDTKKVKNAAFKFELSDWVYDKESAESALTGSSVPQSKFGAWILSVDVDGTITVTGASENATGYLTAALAVNGIVLPGSTNAIMGFVTVIDTSGAFVPDTTALTGGGVTATFTDGNPGLRNIPQDACVTKGKLIIRPKAMQSFLIRASASLASPTALTTATSPPDVRWGPTIATGSAVKFLAANGDTTRASEVLGESSVIGTHEYNMMMLGRKKIKQDSEREVIRSF